MSNSGSGVRLRMQRVYRQRQRIMCLQTGSMQSIVFFNYRRKSTVHFFTDPGVTSHHSAKVLELLLLQTGGF